MFSNSTHFISVPVIASFSDKGEICPLYFKVEGETYRIETFSIKDEVHPWITFRCSIVINDQKKEFELSFHEEQHLWGIKPGLIC